MTAVPIQKLKPDALITAILGGITLDPVLEEFKNKVKNVRAKIVASTISIVL
jgi:hypothetical protein